MPCGGPYGPGGGGAWCACACAPPAGAYGPDGAGAGYALGACCCPCGGGARAKWPAGGCAGSAGPRDGGGAYWLGVGRRCGWVCGVACGGDIMRDGGATVDGGRGGPACMRCPGSGGGAAPRFTLPGRGGGGSAAEPCAVYGEPWGEYAGDGAALGNGDVIAAGLLRLSAGGGRLTGTDDGASFQPPLSRLIGGGGPALDGVPFAIRLGGGGRGTAAAGAAARRCGGCVSEFAWLYGEA